MTTVLTVLTGTLNPMACNVDVTSAASQKLHPMVFVSFYWIWSRHVWTRMTVRSKFTLLAFHLETKNIRYRNKPHLHDFTKRTIFTKLQLAEISYSWVHGATRSIKAKHVWTLTKTIGAVGVCINKPGSRKYCWESGREWTISQSLWQHKSNLTLWTFPLLSLKS